VADGTLQQVVDALAATLGRSVAIDDTRLRLLAASRHFGDEDGVRMESLLNRELPPANRAHVFSCGIAEWTGPGIMEASPEFGSVRRICIPVRHLGILFGYLWLIDADATLPTVGLTAAQDAATDAAMALYREMLLHERADSRNGALMRDLLCSDPGIRVRAGEEIRRDHLLADGRHAVVLVSEVSPGREVPSSDVHQVVRAAAETSAHSLPPASVLHLVDGPRLVLLATSPAPRPDGVLSQHARQVSRRICDALGAGTRVRVGVGSTQPGLEQAWTSHNQAHQALRAGRVLDDQGDLVEWDRLGVFSALLRLPPEELGPAHYPPPLLRLMEADRVGKLVTTLETYLDEAGDAVRTAARLHLHRTTLYYRLGKVEELTGVDLRSGQDRLTLHLGIKLARLGGGLGEAP
jgi:hypothetical protein